MIVSRVLGISVKLIYFRTIDKNFGAYFRIKLYIKKKLPTIINVLAITVVLYRY